MNGKRLNDFQHVFFHAIMANTGQIQEATPLSERNEITSS